MTPTETQAFNQMRDALIEINSYLSSRIDAATAENFGRTPNTDWVNKVIKLCEVADAAIHAAKLVGDKCTDERMCSACFSGQGVCENMAAAKEVQPQAPCQYCDGTGDVHTPTGEWRGQCSCEAVKEKSIE